MVSRPTFYEFFAGGGMARAGLGPAWRCLFANDVDDKKALSYRANWGGGDLAIEDIRRLEAADLPGRADLAWGSFPCQDLSLAGVGAGLNGARSGTFHAFWRLMAALAADHRAPRIVALENVCGTLTSRGGADFAAICGAFKEGGYRLGPLIIDAAAFVPQSRPRLFLVGVRQDVAIDPALIAAGPREPFHTKALARAVAAAGADTLWWNLPSPSRRNLGLADIIEPVGPWHSAERTERIVALMSPVNLAKLREVREAGRRRIGAVYRRTRTEPGGKRQRAEVRFDDLSGCLRTPAGGSSRQTILVVENGAVRSRLITARETARLMGLADDYILPARYTDAYHLTGDGVVVDVVRHLAEHLFEPLLTSPSRERSRAAPAAPGEGFERSRTNPDL